MKFSPTALAAALLFAGAASGQAPPRGPGSNPAPTMAPSPTLDEARLPRPQRARGIPAVLAAEAALTAIATCRASGYKVNALVTDSAGVPIALISGDGAAAITQRIAMSKAQIVIKYKMTSGEVTAKAATDPALAAQLAADPQIVRPLQGAVPIMLGSELIGAIAASGAPTGDKDEPCAAAGLAKIQGRLAVADTGATPPAPGAGRP